ncbi:13222_t:CDS:2, partial [Acaulospora colombiana]
ASTSYAGKAKKLDSAIDKTVQIATITRDATEINPALGPLKASMSTLITVLDTIRKAEKRHEETWITIIKHIHNRIKGLTEQLESMECSDGYRRLDEILARMTSSSTPKKKWRWHIDSRQNGENIKDIERELQGYFDRFMIELNMLNHESIRQNNEVILINSLKTAVSANGKIHKPCMEGTRLGILREINEWKHADTTPQVLWLNDVAGVGKSTVAKQLAEEWKKQGGFAGHFFFSRDMEDTRTEERFFSTIAQQGVSRLSSIAQTAVAKGIQKLFDPASATLEDQCLSIFTEPLVAFGSPTVLVLDAVDECEPRGCQRLLSILLRQLPLLPHLKLFVTSRRESHIEELFQDHNPHRLSLRANQTSNLQDVELYMKNMLENVGLKKEQIRSLVERAGGLFIWASTVCGLLRNFRGNRDHFISRILSQSISQMDHIYEIALDQAIGSDQAEESLDSYMKVLKLIVVAYTPITPNTLNRLLYITDSMETVRSLGSVLDCNGPDQEIRFLHPTFREFLLSRTGNYRFHVDISDAHYLMGMKCLTAMNEGFRDFVHRIRVEEPQQISIELAALPYSSAYWISHVIQTAKGDLLDGEMVSKIDEFFSSRLLDWLFVVCSMDLIDHTGINDGTTTVCKDSWRFLKFYWLQLRKYPSNVYTFFAYTPQSSIFQEVYAKSKSFPHPVVSIGIEQDWPSEVIVKAHKIKVFQLSSSSDAIAVGGSRDHLAVISLWDIQTADGVTATHPCGTKFCEVGYLGWSSPGLGQQLLAIKYEPTTYSLSVEGMPDNPYRLYDLPYFLIPQYMWVFSPRDGQKIALWGREVEVWECSSKRHLFKRPVPTSVTSLRSIHFSPDANFLIYSLDDSLHFISSEDGTSLWNYGLQIIIHDPDASLDRSGTSDGPIDLNSGRIDCDSSLLDNRGVDQQLILSLLTLPPMDIISPTYDNTLFRTADQIVLSSRGNIRNIVKEYVERGAIKISTATYGQSG